MSAPLLQPPFGTPIGETPGPAHAAELTGFAAALLEKQAFRGYELRTCLAAGDRSAVFRAHDKNMDRGVALKIMRPHPDRESAVEEYFSLAGSIARLRCPGAARGLDAGRGDGDFFLAYEFLPGESLAVRLARRQSGKYLEKESLKLVVELARVLQSLFDLGHTHGHLHPGNVMLADGGKPRLADIGFAWNLAWPDDGAAFRRRPDFLPPERLSGEYNIDIRGDLYSLGAIWHWLLIGRPVFGGATPAETVEMHLEANPIPVRELDPRLSAATSQLVLWLLEKDRDARPRTPREFLRKMASHPLLAKETSAENAEGSPTVSEGTDASPADDETTGLNADRDL